MPVGPGQTLLHYRLIEKIGEGGMGVVWKAVDTHLDREVAVKVLPEDFQKDPERLARFGREARLLASLNHPHVAAVHGFEQADGLHFLVLELISGDTLQDRLAGGPLPAEEALRLCAQIAQGLEAAHAKGIIHRDLKPANVKITSAGQAKVLDFGLAKAVEGPGPGGDSASSPTVTSAGTATGVILGTAAYMSPEQARGKPLNEQSDIWAFGCLLYEMLTGKQAFAGETVSDNLAAILRAEPDWSTLPTSVPASLRGLLRRCLTREPARRLHHIADARIEIEQALTEPADVVSEVRAPITSEVSRHPLPWIVAGALAVVAAVALWAPWRSPSSRPEPVSRFELSPPEGQHLTRWRPGFALSPDGSIMIYAAERDNEFHLFLRHRKTGEVHEIAGTTGGGVPFFSPDGEWIAFTAQGKLKKLPVAGGAPVTICDAPDFRGGSWGPDGTIVFSPGWGEGLSRVAAAGGRPEIVTTLTVEQAEGAHLWPQFLPGGGEVLFTVWTSAGLDDTRIEVVSLDSGERKTLLKGGTFGRYSPTGHLLYVRDTTLMATRFDLQRREVVGEPVGMVDDISRNITNFSAQYDLAGDGLLAFMTGGFFADEQELVWVDRNGEITPAIEDRRGFQFARLSPDGRKLAVTVEGPVFHVWVYDFTGGTRARLTPPGDHGGAVWTPDGQRLVYWTTQFGRYTMATIAADGSIAPEQLLPTEHSPGPSSWSPDGTVLAYTETHPDTGGDIWIYSATEGEARPFLRTPQNEWAPVFSPDGRWLAYVSNDTGRYEVYVAPHPGPGVRWQVSRDGGTEPVWNRNGRELFYRHDRALLAVAVETEPEFRIGRSVVLFEGDFEDNENSAEYDVALDGQRFLMIRDTGKKQPDRIHVVLNWFEELRARVPAGR